MHAWNETVAQFSAVIRRGASFAPGEIVSPHYPTERGVGVYRNNYRGNLHDALAGAYPVVRQLVGEDFFRFLARCYVETHDSHSGNLHRYGGEMAQFLTDFDNTRHLAYLPDMARLEWAHHRAYFSDDTPAFDLARLAEVAPESYSALRWQLHPSCALLASPFPVGAIWRAHQQDSAMDFDIDLKRAEHLLIHRNRFGVQVEDIPADELYWLTCAQAGENMGAATEKTSTAFPGFNLGAALSRWLAAEVLADFDLTTELCA
jgi:hypothetical protein